MAKLYIAGPMRDKPNWNFDEFDKAKEQLLSDGFEVISPADMDRLYGGYEKYLPEDFVLTHKHKVDAMRRDLDVLLALDHSKGDGIFLLSGWRDSAGALAEFALANFLGLHIYMQDEVKDDE